MLNKAIAMIGLDKKEYLAPECETENVLAGVVICASDGTEDVGESDGLW